MISVIVPTYNEEKHIEACLNSLLSQPLSKKEYEVIVSDSSSTDKTVKIAKSLADRVFICKKVSAGFGRNRGAEKAKGSTLAFLDADTVASKDWLLGIKESLENEKNVAVTGPFFCFKEDGLLEKFYYMGWSIQNRITTAIGFPLLPGFNFAVRKNAFKKVKGFREDNMVCEDFDLSLKLSKLGKIAYSSKMFTTTSARRVKEMGIVNYALHGMLFLFFRKKYTWSDHRKDW